VNHIPYYSREWSKEQKAAALKVILPHYLAGKEPLRADPDDFVRTDYRPLWKVTNYTSGSTGTPIASICTPDEIRDSLAIREVRSAIGLESPLKWDELLSPEEWLSRTQKARDLTIDLMQRKGRYILAIPSSE
jgi:hypothetical protein